jgi:hypothetical protein
MIFLGPQLGFTLTRSGRLYFGGGPSFGSEGGSWYLAAGYIANGSTTCQQVDNYVEGWSISAGGSLPIPLPLGLKPVLVGVYGNAPQLVRHGSKLALTPGGKHLSDFGTEVGVGNKQTAISLTYSGVPSEPVLWKLPIRW